jgi:hypothetical protein
MEQQLELEFGISFSGTLNDRRLEKRGFSYLKG